MEELKTCPFCGGKAHYNRKKILQGYIVVGYDCKQCGAAATVFTGPITAEKNMKIQATEAWNRRAEPENKPLTVTLPCNIGDTVYYIEYYEKQPIKCGTVWQFGIENTVWASVKTSKTKVVIVDINDLYLTREAAEQVFAARKPEGSKKA